MALEVIDETYTKGTYVMFRRTGVSESGRTLKFDVIAKEDNLRLGRVEWFGRWRKYTFRPLSMTVYEETCLGEIAEFIRGKTREHRAALAVAKAEEKARV